MIFEFTLVLARGFGNLFSVRPDCVRKVKWIGDIETLSATTAFSPNLGPGIERRSVPGHVQDAPCQDQSATDEIGLDERNGQPFASRRPHAPATHGIRIERGDWEMLLLQLRVAGRKRISQVLDHEAHVHDLRIGESLEPHHAFLRPSLVGNGFAGDLWDLLREGFVACTQDSSDFLRVIIVLELKREDVAEVAFWSDALYSRELGGLLGHGLCYDYDYALSVVYSKEKRQKQEKNTRNGTGEIGGQTSSPSCVPNCRVLQYSCQPRERRPLSCGSPAPTLKALTASPGQQERIRGPLLDSRNCASQRDVRVSADERVYGVRFGDLRPLATALMLVLACGVSRAVG